MDYDVAAQRPATGAQRLGAGQRTASGLTFYPLDPRPEEILIEDIAHHLARICRWGGAVRGYYSVAEHSVLLSHYFEGKGDPVLAKWALLHDAAEAYLGDVVRPLKPYFTEFSRFESHLETMIWRHFGLEGELPVAVKAADTAILGDERTRLFAAASDPALNRPGETGLGLAMGEHSPAWSHYLFLVQFYALFGCGDSESLRRALAAIEVEHRRSAALMARLDRALVQAAGGLSIDALPVGTV